MGTGRVVIVCIAVPALLGAIFLVGLMAGRNTAKADSAPGVVRRSARKDPGGISIQPEPAPEAKETPVAGSWDDLKTRFAEMTDKLAREGNKPIGRFEGSGAEETASFRVTTGTQFVCWAVEPKDFNIFGLDFMAPGEGIPKGWVNPSDAEHQLVDSSWMHLAPGTYYIRSHAAGKWIVAMYDQG